MAHFLAVTLMALVSAGPFASGLQCHEGFNMSLNGIPLYFWNERQCYGNSKCIEQELSYSKTISGNTLNADLRYGACMSNAYASYLDCKNLFGKDSKFDPANLLSMIPEFESSITNAVQVFSQNVSASLKELLSDGEGMDSFVDGAFKFYENLGFNFSKAAPLKPSLVKLLSAAFDGQNRAVSQALYEFIMAFDKLDTANVQLSSALRSFLMMISSNYALNQQNVFLTVMMDKGPGLLRSILPDEWQLELWYDVAFKLMGDINPQNWTKSTEDMVVTIKSSYRIPAEVTQYINPILDALPDLAKGSEMNPMYVGRWSLELLKKFSEVDFASRKFSTALSTFISRLTSSPLQEEYMSTITWIPGLFYKMFPGSKAIIQEVYTKMGDGFSSFNFLNMSSTAPETKLSVMIKNVIIAVGGEATFRSTPLFNTFVVNFAKMFYNLMDVNTVDYTKYIDDFSMVIDAEFESWPRINVGKLISKLITTMGGTVPNELRPLLENMQPVLTVAMEQPLKPSKLIMAFYGITASYKTPYPSSPFPDIVERYIRTMYSLITLDYNANPMFAMQMANQLSLELQYIHIDLQFALIKTYDFTNDELYQMMVKAWPDYGLYIRVLKAMDSKDVKQLLKDIIRWISTPPPHTTEGFVIVTKPTFQRVTKSIETYLGELRQSFAPNSCRLSSCDKDLCNALGYVTVTTTPQTTSADVEITTDGIISDTTSVVTDDTTEIGMGDETTTDTDPIDATISIIATTKKLDSAYTTIRNTYTTDGTTVDNDSVDTTAEPNTDEATVAESTTDELESLDTTTLDDPTNVNIAANNDPIATTVIVTTSTSKAHYVTDSVDTTPDIVATTDEIISEEYTTVDIFTTEEPTEKSSTGGGIVSGSAASPVKTTLARSTQKETPGPSVLLTERSTAVLETTSGVLKFTYYTVLNVFSAWLAVYLLYR